MLEVAKVVIGGVCVLTILDLMAMGGSLPPIKTFEHLFLVLGAGFIMAFTALVGNILFFAVPVGLLMLVVRGIIFLIRKE